MNGTNGPSPTTLDFESADRAVWEANEAAKREIQQRRQRADADIRRECEAWAQKKYGSSKRRTLAPMLVVLPDVKCVSPEQRRQIARKAALARWKRRNVSA